MGDISRSTYLCDRKEQMTVYRNKQVLSPHPSTEPKYNETNTNERNQPTRKPSQQTNDHDHAMMPKTYQWDGLVKHVPPLESILNFFPQEILCFFHPVTSFFLNEIEFLAHLVGPGVGFVGFGLEGEV